MSLYRNRNISNFESVLILRHLDVLVLRSIVSWVIGTFSLRCHLDDSGFFHFDCVEVDDFFRGSAASITGSATQGNDAVILVSSLSFGLVLSCHVRRLSGLPRPSSAEAPVYRGCLCRDPPVCPPMPKQGGIGQRKRQPLVVVVVCSGQCLRVRGRVSRSCATGNSDKECVLHICYHTCVLVTDKVIPVPAASLNGFAPRVMRRDGSRYPVTTPFSDGRLHLLCGHSLSFFVVSTFS